MPPVPKQESLDPSLYPQFRETVFKHYVDQRKALKYVSIAALLFAVGFLLQVVLVGIAIFRPPVVLDQNAGYLQWRTTDWFRLSPDNVRGYIREIFQTLFTVTPGNYDLRSLSGRVRGDLLAKMQDSPSSDLVAGSQQRKIYQFIDVRAYSDPANPQFITYAVLGQRTLQVFDTTGVRPFTEESRRRVDVIYLSKTTPNPRNPYGLILEGLVAKGPEDGERIWSVSKPLETNLPTNDQTEANKKELQRAAETGAQQ